MVRCLVGYVQSHKMFAGWPLPFPYLIKAGTSSAASMVLASGPGSKDRQITDPRPSSVAGKILHLLHLLQWISHAKLVRELPASRAWFPKGKDVQSSVHFQGWSANPASCFESVRQVYIGHWVKLIWSNFRHC